MIDKKAKTIIYILLGVIAILFVFESSRPRPLNWKKSFTSGDKIPFGSYVLFDQLGGIFNGNTIQSVDQVPIDFLQDHQDLVNANYIFINDYLRFDQVETDYLLEFVARGNKVFISSNNTNNYLADTLGLESTTNYSRYSSRDTIKNRLVNPRFKDRTYIYDKGSAFTYFEVYDTLHTKVLGEVLPFKPSQGYVADYIEQSMDPDQDVQQSTELQERTTLQTPQVNFVEVTYGQGAFYYQLNPIAFTNYYMLKDGKHQYAVEALAYMNDGPVYFDDYGKSGRKVITSPIRFVLSQPALKWAYYIALLGVIFYMVFASKRRQRIIPIIDPLPNSTVEFTKTIGSLYYQTGDYSSIIQKKITYFLEHIRSQYYIDTQQLDQVFIKRLAVKSGKPLEVTQQVITYIIELKNLTVHHEYQLKLLHNKIESFLKQ